MSGYTPTATAAFLMKQLKSELAALDRIIAQALSQKEIAAELAPKHDEKDSEEVKPDAQQQAAKVIEAPPSSQSQSADDKKSMVAEPIEIYRPQVVINRPSFRPFGT